MTIGAALVKKVELPTGTRDQDVALVVLDKNDRRDLALSASRHLARSELPAARNGTSAAAGCYEQRRTLRHRLASRSIPSCHAAAGNLLARSVASRSRRLALQQRDGAVAFAARRIWRCRKAFSSRDRRGSTSRNANPYDEEPHYNLGLTLRISGATMKPTMLFTKRRGAGRWQAVGFQRLAEIDATRLDWPKAAEHALKSVRRDADNLLARNLAAIALRMSGRKEAGRPISRTNEGARSDSTSAAAIWRTARCRVMLRWCWTLRSTLRDTGCSQKRPRLWSAQRTHRNGWLSADVALHPRRVSRQNRRCSGSGTSLG